MNTTQNIDTKQVCFIDKFYIPKNSIAEFIERMNYNREFVKNIPGLIKSEAYQQNDAAGDLTIITTAVWKNQDHLEKAKSLVQTEFKRINFNPTEFYQHLNVKLERGLYLKLND